MRWIHKLPLYGEGGLFAIAAILLQAGIAYIRNTPEEAFTTQGLVIALVTAAFSVYTSRARLYQKAPPKPDEPPAPPPPAS